MSDRDKADDRKLHAAAMSTWRLSNAAFTDQRVRELEDLQFIDEDDQWPAWAKASRGGESVDGLPKTPPRPMITINKLIQPVDQLLAQERQAKLSLDFIPEGDGADDDTAEVYEDIVRARQHESRANLARRWAFERAGKAGMGWYRIDTVYADVEDLTAETFNDQDIVWRRILNQASIYPDPYAQEPDFSDMEFLHETVDLPYDLYKRRFPDAEPTESDSANELSGVGDPLVDWGAVVEDGWATMDDDGKSPKTIRVSRYWYFEHTKRTRVLLVDGQLAWKDELPTPIPDGMIKAEREVDDKQVYCCTVDAFTILEQDEWNGRYIPYVPVIGKEANVNGKRSWKGLVRPSIGGQQLFNFEASALVETVNLGTKAPYIAFKEMIEGYEAMWDASNTRAFPVLYVNMIRDGQGSPLPFPERNTAEPPIQAILQTLHESGEFIKATTGFFDPSLGDVNPGDLSGKAIQSLQRQGEIGSSGYLDNLGTVSLPYEGKILRDLIPRIYDRPGRILPGLGADNERRRIMVNQPHVMQNGQHVPVQAGTPGAKVYDLKAGQYSVTASVGKQEATKREASSAMMGQIAQAAPQLVPSFADLWVGSLDGPGMKQIADRLHKMLPPQLLQGDDGQPSPEQLQAQVQQVTQQFQHLQQQYQQAVQMIQTEQVKSQARLQETQLDNDTKIKLAYITAGMQLEIAAEKASLEQARTAVLAAHEQLAELRAEMATDIHARRDHDHAMQAQIAQQAHEAASQASEQQHEMALASHQAALAPEPAQPAEGA